MEEENSGNNNDNNKIIVFEKVLQEKSPLVSLGFVSDSDIESTIRVLEIISSLADLNDNDEKLPPSFRSRLEKYASEQQNNTIEKKNHNEKASTQSSHTSSSFGLKLYQHSSLRQIRKSIHSIFDNLQKKQMYDGKSFQEYNRNKSQKFSVKRQMNSDNSQQRKMIANVVLRKKRIEQLERLKMDGEQEEMGRFLSNSNGQNNNKKKLLDMMVPDGAVDTSNYHHDVVKPQDANSNTIMLSLKCNEATADKKIEEENSNKKNVLPNLIQCYCCKARFRILHFFYDHLCPKCASLNYQKRFAQANLGDNDNNNTKERTLNPIVKRKIAIVTGARLKIGYQTSLKLLRSGAIVIATTRFPNSACEIYAKENDFNVWKDRIHIYGLDLRDILGIEAFVSFIKQKFKRLDILINNACQTIRRPVGYYKPVVENEVRIYKQAQLKHGNSTNNNSNNHLDYLLRGCQEFEQFRKNTSVAPTASSSTIKGDNIHNNSSNNMLASQSTTPNTVMTTTGTGNSSDNNTTLTQTDYKSTGISYSAKMSQTVLINEDINNCNGDNPNIHTGIKDINNQCLDLRTVNSWRLKIDEISTPELLETMLINAVAPFILNSRLIPLMAATTTETETDDDVDKDDEKKEEPSSKKNYAFIINVSAMEGKFYRYKLPNHPHTNMAKAGKSIHGVFMSLCDAYVLVLSLSNNSLNTQHCEQIITNTYLPICALFFLFHFLKR